MAGSDEGPENTQKKAEGHSQLNGCCLQKLPIRFRDCEKTVLMSASGWFPDELLFGIKAA